MNRRLINSDESRKDWTPFLRVLVVADPVNLSSALAEGAAAEFSALARIVLKSGLDWFYELPPASAGGLVCKMIGFSRILSVKSGGELIQ